MSPAYLRYGPLADVARAVDLDSMDTDDLRGVILNMIDHIERVESALKDLVQRCDGEEGVRADGSNIQTIAAHAVLSSTEEE